MNRDELQKILCQERIKESCYSLEAKNIDPDEALCLRQQGGEWVVYYSERGLQTGRRIFKNEPDACFHMLETLRADPTTKIDWRSGFGASNGT